MNPTPEASLLSLVVGCVSCKYRPVGNEIASKNGRDLLPIRSHCPSLMQPQMLFKPLNTYDSGVFCYRNKTEKDVQITMCNNAHRFTGRYGTPKAATIRVQSDMDGFSSSANCRTDSDAEFITSVVTQLSEINLEVKYFQLQGECFSRFRGN